VVETGWDSIVQALVGALVIEHVAKIIKAALLCTKRCGRRFRRVLLQRAMHPLVVTVLLRSAGLYPLMYDPELHPADREFGQPHQPGARKRCAVVGPDPCWDAVLPHRCLADRSDLAQVRY
jgi:hypothetical protein